MPYYIAPYIGTGTFLEPFRPRGSDQAGWSAIDLRPDGGATLGGGGLNACLLHLPLADPDPQLRLMSLDRADSIGPGLRQAIVARLGLLADPASGRWDDLAAELLLGPPPGGWKPIRPTIEGAFEVWLGGLLKRLPVVRGGSSISESFNQADNTILGPDLSWTEVSGSWSTISNQAALGTTSGTALHSARAGTTLATVDQYGQVTVVALSASDTDSVAGAATRFAAAASTFYTAHIRQGTTGSDFARSQKQIAGSDTTIGSNTNITWASTDTIKIEANGTTIKRYYNGSVQDTVTDTAIDGVTVGGKQGGICGYNSSVANGARVDVFEAADLAVAAAAPPGHGMLLSGFRNQVIQRV